MTIRHATALLLLLVSICTAVTCAEAKKKVPIEQMTGPIQQSLQERGLIVENVKARDILKHSGQYHANTTIRNFSGPVLAYVTPWNAKGYEVAQRWRAKFTHISPVWYQVRWNGTAFQLHGQHDVDVGWIAQLRVPVTPGARTPKIVPRVLFELEASAPHLSSEAGVDMVQLMAAEVQRAKLDGVVLEVWSLWHYMRQTLDPRKITGIVMFLQSLRSRLQQIEASIGGPKELLLAVPPAQPADQNGPFFVRDQLLALHEVVDGFTIMTYDHGRVSTPGFNAPLPWVENNIRLLLDSEHAAAHKPQDADGEDSEPDDVEVDGHKVLLGLNFYGNYFKQMGQGGPIIGHEYLGLLDRERPPVAWHEEAAEHLATVKDRQDPNKSKRHLLVFPSLLSIQARLDVARHMKCGISIWEVGQGLDYFYDLL